MREFLVGLVFLFAAFALIGIGALPFSLVIENNI